MATPYLGEIKIVAFNFPPKGWAFCNGQLLPINQNQALFAILGTTYGGNGIQTFALPNFQGSVPIHVGGGFNLGETGGAATNTLTLAAMPSHGHAASAAPVAADQPAPGGNLWADTTNGYSTASPNATMSPAGVGAAGGGQPYDNFPPYLVLSFIIALVGIFPSRS
jgi:microcystin-dependent protein